MNQPKENIQIAVIGLGPRGIGIIEQICLGVKNFPLQTFELILFDPNSFGEGCHQQNQPRHFLMNTAAAQLSWSSASTDEKQSFAHWLSNKKISTGEKARTASSSSGYYSRRVFGQYLRESLENILANRPENLAWQWVQEAVIDLNQNTDQTWDIITPTKTLSCIDYVHLCTGHGLQGALKKRALKGQNRETPQNHESAPPQKTAPTPNTAHPPKPAPEPLIDFVYPCEDQLSRIQPHETVLVEGMGLTAFDVVAELTEGRGGRFIPKPSNSHDLTGNKGLLDYIPSGNEPAIIAYSRTGLPLKAKPKGQDQAHQKKIYHHLSDEVILELKQNSPLDFEQDIVPLIENEIKQAAYETLLLQDPVLAQSLQHLNEDNTHSAADRLAQMEAQLPAHNRITLDTLLNPVTNLRQEDPATFQQSLEAYLERDYLMAEAGIRKNAEKAATNALRDIREKLAELIDFSMLSGASHEWLYRSFMPKMKWLSVGPPRSRIAEWLALSKAGILNISLGPNPVCTRTTTQNGEKWRIQSCLWPSHSFLADVKIQARIQVSEEIGEQLLVKNLTTKSLARLFQNDTFLPGGLSVTRDFRLITQDGHALESVWATGILTEGERFYTFSLPSPGKASRFHEDAKTAVNSMFQRIAMKQEKLQITV